jgi:hypothetical protein
VTAAFLALVVLCPADASTFARLGRLAEAEALHAWPRAGPEERERHARLLARVDRARRFVEALPVVVDLDGRPIALADLFTEVLEPALCAKDAAGADSAAGAGGEHERAIRGLDALAHAYAAPNPVRTGTLNLLLDYAHAVLASDAVPPRARSRLFLETARALRVLEGRAEADARTRWLLHERLVPALHAFARAAQGEPTLLDAVAEAASILASPSISDEAAQARLAPFATGVHSRALLLAAYRRRELDEAGLVALARSVDAQAREDQAFAAGCAPLLLELLCEEALPGAERRRLGDLVLDTLARLPAFRESAVDLLAACHGGPPQPLEHYEAVRGDAVPPPESSSGARIFRLLRVVLRRRSEEEPLEVSEVTRADLPMFLPLRARDPSGAERFLGALLASPEQDHPDFVGPPPGAPGRDNRLVRRTLRLERVAVHWFGPREQEAELFAALPDDASEPVPREGASLPDVLALVQTRFERTDDPTERRDLARLLARAGAPAAEALAVAHARWPEVLEELLPLAEAGREASLRAVAAGVESMPEGSRERALAVLARAAGGDGRARLRELAARGPLALACPAAEALLHAADASGALALLRRDEVYARACGSALALRLSPLAGTLRVEPQGAPDAREVGAAAVAAFAEADGEPWTQYAKWLRLAFQDPDAALSARARREPLRIPTPGGYRSCSGAEFADHWAAAIAAGRDAAKWAPLARFVLSPHDPGRGIPPERLERLLDALEAAASAPELERALVDNLVILACAQYGTEAGTEFLGLANRRLLRLAGARAPRGVEARAGVLWPVWAAERN